MLLMLILLCLITVTCTAGKEDRDDVCVDCLAGSYKTDQMKSCEACPENMTTENNGSTKLYECDGRYITPRVNIRL